MAIFHIVKSMVVRSELLKPVMSMKLFSVSSRFSLGECSMFRNEKLNHNVYNTVFNVLKL